MDKSLSAKMPQKPAGKTSLRIVLLATAIILTACSFMPAALTETAATVELQVTEVTSAENPGASETPVVGETPTEVFSEIQNKEEIVKNINEYFNEEGKYSLESFQSQSQFFFGETELRDGDLPLGNINDVIWQFILLGGNYDGQEQTLHLYLGTLDKNKQRVVFDLNFPRTFVYGRMEPPIHLMERQTALYDFIAVNIDEVDKSDLISHEDWELFITENQSLPISIRMEMTSVEELLCKTGYCGQAHILEYDLGRNLRVVVGEKLNHLGSSKYSYPDATVTGAEAESLAACLWSKVSFKGIESLNTECPSNHGLSNVFIRRLYP